MILPDRRRRLAVAAAAALVSLAAYASTLGPEPYWQDAGLFLAGVKVGGGLAPSGYPLYLLLGQPFVAALLAVAPGLGFVRAVHAFSAVFGALAAGAASLGVMLLLTPGFRFFSAAAPDAETGPDSPAPPLSPLALFAGLLGGLMAGLSYSLWFQAITAEVYSMHAFFALATIALALRLGMEGPLGPRATRRQRGLLLALAATHGLSCANHLTTGFFVAALGLAVGGWLSWTVVVRRARPVLPSTGLLLAAAVLWGTLGLLPYAYLPWAATHRPLAMYDDVLTPGSFVAHITGTKWTAREESYGWQWERLGMFPGQLWDELFLAGLAGVALGVRRLLRTPGTGLRLALGAFLAIAWAAPMVYTQGSEYDFWLLPFFLVLEVVAAVGLHDVLAAAGVRVAPRPVRAALTSLVAAAALLPLALVNGPLLDRREDHVPADFARGLFRHLEPGAILFASSDQECSLAYWLHTVEGHRPDVALIMQPILADPWYTRWLRRRYPDLKMDEPGPEGPFTNDEWVGTIMQNNWDRRASYISKRPAFPIPDVIEWVPVGSLWKLDPRAKPEVDLRHWTLEYRNPDALRKPARKHFQIKMTDPETGAPGIRRVPYVEEIRKFHQQGFLNLGDWSLAHGQPAQAVTAYERVRAENPDLLPPGLAFALGRAYASVGRDAGARRVRATPFPAPVLLAFANDSLGRGEYDPAVWAYERLRTEAGGPAVPGLVLGLAKAYFATRRPEDARKLLRETSAPRELVADASCYRGDLLFESRDHAGALAHFEEVRRELGDPVPAPLAFRLGKALFAVGRLEEARALLETIASPPVRVAEAALYLGQIAHKRGEEAKAREWFAKARALDPEFWERNRAMLRQAGVKD